MPLDAVTWKQQGWTPCNSTCTVAAMVKKKLGSFDATVRWMNKNGTEAIVMQMASCNAQVASKYVTSPRWWQCFWRKFLMALIQYGYFTISPILLLFGVAILVHNPKRVNRSMWPQLSEVESACIFATSDATCADTNWKQISRWFLATCLGWFKWPFLKG